MDGMKVEQKADRAVVYLFLIYGLNRAHTTLSTTETFTAATFP